MKLLLDLTNYTTKKILKDATGIDISYLAAKSDFIDLKAKVGKPDVNKLVNAPRGLNDLKTKLDDLDVGRLKTFSVYLKKLSDLVSLKTQNSTK